MKVSDALAAIERLFLDIIGSVFAGALLLFLLVFFFDARAHGQLLETQQGGTIFLLVGASYALGHFLTYVGSALVEPLFRYAFAWIASDMANGLKKHETKAACERDDFGKRWSVETKKLIERLFGWTNLKRDELTLQSPAVADFIAAIKKQGFVPKDREFKSVNDARNLALSVEGVDKAIVYRFTFLGLFNLTTAAAIAVAAGLWVTWHVLSQLFPAFAAGLAGPLALQPRPFSWLFVIGAVVLIIGLLDRNARFSGISMRVPFADATMRAQRSSKAVRGSSSEASAGALPRIYLAGGFKSGWQDQIRAEFAGSLDFIDPRKHEIVPGKSYTAWDLKGVQAADLIFAYLEATNPGGYALALEVGYAKALGKTVIFVEDPPTPTDSRARYLEMVRAAADYQCLSIAEGVSILRSLVEQKLVK